MNILVCVKPVPDPARYSDLRIDSESKRLVREGIDTIINPTDRNALEEALRLREENGGKVTVLSMAPEFSRDKMLECLAMGADEAYLLSDSAYVGADTYATSFVLAKAADKIGPFDLILTANESADGATSHVPVQLAEWMGLPYICRVSSIDKEDGSFKVNVKGDGAKFLFRINAPCVIAVNSEINKPRFVNAMGLIKAKKKPLSVWGNEDLCLDPEKTGIKGSPTKAGELLRPDTRRESVNLGEADEVIAKKIVDLIDSAGV